MNNSSPQSPYVSYQMVEPSTSGGNPQMVLLGYLRNWPWYVLSIGLALGLAYAYLLFKQPTYRIQASLLLQDEKKGTSQANPLKELESYNPKKVVENELEVLHSFSLMDRVITKLDLDNRYYRATTFGKREIYSEAPIKLTVEGGTPALYKKPLKLDFVNSQTVKINEKAYPLNQFIQTPYGRLRVQTRRPVSDTTETILVQVQPHTNAVDNYLGNLKAEPTSKTSTVIHLTLEDAVPQKGEAILNQLIREYNQAAVMDKNKVAASTLKFIEDRLGNVSGELASVEKDVEQYKSTQGITDLGVQGQTFIQTVAQNDAALNQVNIQLAALNDLQKYLVNQSNKRGSAPATIGLNDPVLLSLISGLTQLELQRDHLAQTTADGNPVLQGLDNQIKATRTSISDNVQTMKSQLTSSQQQYEAKNQKLEGQIRNIPQQDRSLTNITRQQQIKNNLYTYLLQKREETAVAFASAISDSRTIDTAQSSNGPVKPVPIVIYALFGLVGLLIPTGAIAGRNAFNNRVTRRGDVEDVTQVPILGEIMKKRHRDVLVVAPKSQSYIAEQIRTIRTNLQLMRETTDSQVMLFTSSMSGEGKSFISLNLGASLSMLSQPTVILEMDMRLPKLHQAFNLDNSVGISTYLNNEATLDEILQPVPGYPNFFIIPSGPLPSNPSELLSGPHLKQLIDELRTRFSYVIVDAPPIGIVTDAQLIAPFADTTLFVVRHDVTPKRCLKIIDTLYREQRFQKLNIILNAVGGNNESYHFSNRDKNSYSYN